MNERDALSVAIEAIATRFRSLNRIPVEKATVPAEEWNALLAALVTPESPMKRARTESMDRMMRKIHGNPAFLPDNAYKTVDTAFAAAIKRGEISKCCMGGYRTKAACGSCSAWAENHPTETLTASDPTTTAGPK